jgi:ABC-type uncharacterized transport system fused permease/ATPase subunit
MYVLKVENISLSHICPHYGLVRVRENAESIAFYGGEESEIQLLLQRFKSAFENLTVRFFC